MSSIKTLIDAYIKRNANQEITGPVLNGVLTAIADALGTPFIGEDGYWYTYDPETGQFVQTDTPAQGESGVNDAWAAVGVSPDPQPLPSVDVIYDPTLRQLAFTFYDIQGPKGDQGTPGITGASVSVDANVGTPSVDASIVNSILTLAFHNLRGAAAGFGTPTISVGANQGTPSASVTASGPDTAKVFNFAFDGLKGETGPQGPQGPQGNPGSSQDYPFTLANNLTTDDSTVALTAAMGVQLEGEVSQLSQEVTGNIVKDITWSYGYIQAATGLIRTSSLSKFSQPILLKAGEKVTIGTQNSNIGIICSTNADSVAVGDTVTVIKATSSSDQFETYEYTAETDIKIVVCVLASNYNLSFSDTNSLAYKINNAATKQELSSLGQEVSSLGQEMAGLIGDVEDYVLRDNYYFTTGEDVADGDWYEGILIPYDPAKTYTLECPDDLTSSSPQQVRAFASDKITKVDYKGYSNGRTLDHFQSQTAYIALSVRKADAKKFAVYENGVEVFRGSETIQDNIPKLREVVETIDNNLTGLIANLTLEITKLNGYVAYSSDIHGPYYESDDNWYVGELITVANGDQILINVASDINTGSSQKLGVYDSNGNLFEFYSIANNRTITIPNDSFAYIALSTRITDASLFKLTVNGVLRYQGSSTVNLSIPTLYKQVGQLEEKIGSDDIYSRNADKLPLLFASANKNLRLQFLIATDSHEGWGALQNAVDFANKCEYIQALFVLGDCTGQAFPSLSTFEQYNQIINTCTKPVFCLAGNHDCGYEKRLRYTALEDKICEYVIEPTYQHLAAGEYTQGKAYYYHDFADKKVRAIFLYEYDEPISIVENAYWEAVAFDSTKPQYTIGAQYDVNDIVNFGLYTANSFKCIQAHTSSDENEIKLNEYRGYRFIGQTQMAWLVSTMLSAPSDYNIIICTHIPASSGYSNTLFRTSKFCTQFLNDSDVFNGMADDYLGILVEAYNNGSSGTIKVAGKDTFAYLNVLEDAGDNYAYEISYDFSGKNNGAKFVCFFSGHTHVDCVFKNGRNQFCITPTFTTATTRQFNTNDVPRNPDPRELAYDALTAVALDTINNCVVLTRVGTTGTTDGYLRDVDRIDMSAN